MLGLCVGSFLNVCIWRIPRGESVVSPPSHCPGCDREIRWYENIPLLSWLVLRGKCSGCGKPISIRYFFVELLTGIMFLSVWFRAIQLGYSLYDKNIVHYLAVTFIAVVFVILTAFIDWEHRIIPNKITYPVLLAGIASAALFPDLWPRAGGSRWLACSFACASSAVWGIILALFAYAGKMIFKKDALGWGDVKYMAAAAALFGPVGAFFILFTGSLAGSAAGIALVAFKKGKMKTGIPFGPFLAAATYLWILCGNEAVRAYSEFIVALKGH
jgi:leader peptidase (prepilin peptidase)/N-methyltransferase